MSESPLDADQSPAHEPSESEQLHAKATIAYKSEFVRKLIHLCSLSIPIIYYFISKQFALAPAQ